MLPGILYTGAGEDVMEMGEQHVLPGLYHLLFRKSEAGKLSRQSGHGLRVLQSRFQTAVAALDPALGGIAAGGEIVQLVIHHRQFVPHTLRFLEEFMEGAEPDLGVNRPLHHLQGTLHVPSGGAAAMVAHAVDHQACAQSHAASADLREACGHLRRDGSVVPVGLLVGQDFLSGRRFVAVENLLPAVPPAMVVVFHFAEPVNLRHVGAVSEGVRGEVHIQPFHAPDFLHVVFGVLDVAQQGLACGHVLVRLHPGSGGDFPAALGDALLDFLHHIRVILFHDFVHRALGLGIFEFRVLVHDVQHGAEGGQRRRHGLVEAPHPVHVDMGMGGQDELVALGLLRHGRQDSLRRLAVLIGQHALCAHLPQQEIQRLLQHAVIAPAVLLGDMQGELQFADDPVVGLVGTRDVRLLFFGHAEGILVPCLLPVPTDGCL